MFQSFFMLMQSMSELKYSCNKHFKHYYPQHRDFLNENLRSTQGGTTNTALFHFLICLNNIKRARILSTNVVILALLAF